MAEAAADAGLSCLGTARGACGGLHAAARCLLGRRGGLREGGSGPAVLSGAAGAIASSLGERRSARPAGPPPAARTMGQCGITSSKTVLVFLNLIFWVSWRAARVGGGLCAARGDQAGAGASRGVARALRPRSPWWGPSGARRRPRRWRAEVWGGLRPAGTVPGYAGPRDASLRGALFAGLSLSGRQARNGTLPVSRVRCLCLSPRRASGCPQVM